MGSISILTVFLISSFHNLSIKFSTTLKPESRYTAPIKASHASANILSCRGPQHNPFYKVSVKIHESNFFYGTGNSKKVAEHNAAKKIIKDLKIK